jgi:hypothetical protein
VWAACARSLRANNQSLFTQGKRLKAVRQDVEVGRPNAVGVPEPDLTADGKMDRIHPDSTLNWEEGSG